MIYVGPKAYIHKKRLISNILKIRKFVGNTDLMIVLKANAYGHGVHEIASSLKDIKGLIFAVFSIEEAIQLRELFFKNDILIFSKIQLSYLELAQKYNFILNISSFEDFEYYQEYFNNKKRVPRFHLKFDVGMNRLGYNVRDANKLFKIVSENKYLKPEGVYSHFSNADEGNIAISKLQLDTFKNILDLAESKNINFKFKHCSNSGSILNIKDSYFNLVRVGMLMYGALPSDEVTNLIGVKPVMSFCGNIVNLRKVSKGTKISYGGLYKTSKATTIGVVQTGFADGFPRPWYEKGYVSCNGVKFNIAGRVCMDQLMVDFGDSKVSVNDEVLFFGKKGKDSIPVEKIASAISTTTYVILTGIQGRTRRFILDESKKTEPI